MFRYDISTLTLVVKRRISLEVVDEGLLIQKKRKIRKKQNYLLTHRFKNFKTRFVVPKFLHANQTKPDQIKPNQTKLNRKKKKKTKKTH